MNMVFGKDAMSMKSIEYKGFVSQNEKFELLKRAWLLIHPSKGEGWGLTAIEANSVGTPVIGYDVNGLRDSIKSGETGILTPMRPDVLADATMKVLEDKKLLSEMSRNAQEWAYTFNWEKSGQESWQIINQTLNT